MRHGIDSSEMTPTAVAEFLAAGLRRLRDRAALAPAPVPISTSKQRAQCPRGETNRRIKLGRGHSASNLQPKDSKGNDEENECLDRQSRQIQCEGAARSENRRLKRPGSAGIGRRS